MFLFSSCIQENTNSTTFSGKVIETNDQSLNNAFFILTAERYDFNHSKLVRRDTVFLDSDNNFDWTIPAYDEKISSIGLMAGIKEGTSNEIIMLELNKLECSPFDCLNFKPGKKYDFDLIITLPEN